MYPKASKFTMSTLVLNIMGQSALPQQWMPAMPPSSWIVSMISFSFSGHDLGRNRGEARAE